MLNYNLFKENTNSSIVIRRKNFHNNDCQTLFSGVKVRLHVATR